MMKRLFSFPRTGCPGGAKGGKPSWWVAWRVAIRPFAYPASVIPVLLGWALARHAGRDTQWGLLALTCVGMCAFHTAANLLNDVFDFRRGADRRALPCSGALVRGWITERQVLAGAVCCLGLGVLCGLLLISRAGFMILWLGLAGTLLTVGYTTPRFCFKYAGWGDAAVFLGFGLLPVYGSWWVQTRTWDWRPVLWSLPPAGLTTAILHANNWRDMESDRRALCRTLAGRLGPAACLYYDRILVLGPFVLSALYILTDQLLLRAAFAPLSACLVFLALPAVGSRLRRMHGPQGELRPTLVAETARLQLLFGSLLLAAFLW